MPKKSSSSAEGKGEAKGEVKTKTKKDKSGEKTKKDKSGEKTKNREKRKKSKTVKLSTSPSNKMAKSSSVAYWSYKAFQVLRLGLGDITPVIELGAEMVGEGLKIYSKNQSIREAISGVVGKYGGINLFRRSVKSFGKFSRDLAGQLLLKGKPEEGAKIQEADRLYELFKQADTDGSKSISIEEFVNFCAQEGISQEDAEVMFYKADVDGSGEISFPEWTNMMLGRVGRDEKMFNCAGRHGLRPYTCPLNGVKCDFCGAQILAGSLAAACRRCDCDACGECYRRHFPPSTAGEGSFDCVGNHGLVAYQLQGEAVCDWCNRRLPHGSVSIGCVACNCDGCLECAANSLDGFCASPRTCHGRHGLRRAVVPSYGFSCDFCRRPLAAGETTYSCRICEVDACVACIWADHRRVVTTGRSYGCRGNHELRAVYVMDYTQLSRCDWCCASLHIGERLLRCEGCDVDICNRCVSSNFTPHNLNRPPPPPVGNSDDEDHLHPGSHRDPKDEFEGTPFHYDSIVRVIGAEDEEIDGRLMTVVGYERHRRKSSRDTVVLHARAISSLRANSSGAPNPSSYTSTKGRRLPEYWIR